MAFDNSLLEIMQAFLSYRTYLDERVSKICTAYPNASLIQISPNIPGADKKVFPAKELHLAGVRAVQKMIVQEAVSLVAHQEVGDWPFCLSFFVVTANPNLLKGKCLDIEESHPLGRFWDMDVYQYNGRKVTREMMGRSERRCFLCSNPAKVCSFQMRHSHRELLAFIQGEYIREMTNERGHDYV